MIPILTALASPITSIFTSIVGAFQHKSEMADLTKQKELEIEKTKVELAKQADNADQLVALENLKQPLGDAGFRRILVCIIALPLVMLLPDLIGYSQYGSAVVSQYFTLVNKIIPETYQLFLTSMVAAYFGIMKVKETFFTK